MLELLIYDGIYYTMFSTDIYYHLIIDTIKEITNNYNPKNENDILDKEDRLFNGILLSINILSTTENEEILLELYRLIVKLIKINKDARVLCTYVINIENKLLHSENKVLEAKFLTEVINHNYLYSFGIIKNLIDANDIEKTYIIDYLINNDNNVNNNIVKYVTELEKLYDSHSEQPKTQLLVLQTLYKYLLKGNESKLLRYNLSYVFDFLKKIFTNSNNEVQAFTIKLFYYYVTTFSKDSNSPKDVENEVRNNVKSYYTILKDKTKDNSSLLPYLIPIIKNMVEHSMFKSDTFQLLLKYTKYTLTHYDITTFSKLTKSIGEILAYVYCVLKYQDESKISVTDIKINVEEISISKYLSFYNKKLDVIHELWCLILLHNIKNNKCDEIFTPKIILSLLSLQNDNKCLIEDYKSVIQKSNVIITKDNINNLYELLFNVVITQLNINNSNVYFTVLLLLIQKDIKYSIDNNILLHFLNVLNTILTKKENINDFKAIKYFDDEFSPKFTNLLNEKNMKLYTSIIFNYYKKMLMILDDNEKTLLYKMINTKISNEYLIHNIILSYFNKSLSYEFIEYFYYL